MSDLVMDRSSVECLDLACSTMGLEFGWEDLRAGGGISYGTDANGDDWS